MQAGGYGLRAPRPVDQPPGASVTQQMGPSMAEQSGAGRLVAIAGSHGEMLPAHPTPAGVATWSLPTQLCHAVLGPTCWATEAPMGRASGKGAPRPDPPCPAHKSGEAHARHIPPWEFMQIHGGEPSPAAPR